LLGYREDVGRLLAACDIFVMPSLSEGQSLAILEAMSMKCALIVTSQGSHNEYLKDGRNALIVHPGDADAITSAIDTFCKSEDLRKSFGKKAYESFMNMPILKSSEWQQDFYDYLLKSDHE
jgi:glycosyltransferase involved in cell wall biosynthesis